MNQHWQGVQWVCWRSTGRSKKNKQEHTAYHTTVAHDKGDAARYKPFGTAKKGFRIREGDKLLGISVRPFLQSRLKLPDSHATSGTYIRHINNTKYKTFRSPRWLLLLSWSQRHQQYPQCPSWLLILQIKIMRSQTETEKPKVASRIKVSRSQIKCYY